MIHLKQLRAPPVTKVLTRIKMGRRLALCVQLERRASKLDEYLSLNFNFSIDEDVQMRTSHCRVYEKLFALPPTGNN